MPVVRVEPTEGYSRPQFAKGCATQDDVVDAIFAIIGEGGKTLVDVGIGNSWHDGPSHRELLLSRAWRGICLEGTSQSVKEYKSIYQHNDNVKIMHRRLDFPTDASVLDEVISDELGVQTVDYLTLRLRGPEWQALEALKHRPRVLGLLFNPSMPPEIDFVQETAPDVYVGSSLLALTNLARNIGYELAYVDRLAFFVNKDEHAMLDIGDYSIQRLWSGGEWQSRVMVGMDGTLIIGGNQKLLWNRLGREGMLSFDQEDIQIIPKSFRRLCW